MAWDLTYEQGPRTSNNPGYGAQAIRDLKQDIRERLDRFNVWGATETSLDLLGGTPREGSARVQVTDSGSTGRDDIIGEADQLVYVGQIKVDLSQRATDREADGIAFADSAQDNTANLKKTVSVVMHDDITETKVVELFTYDSMVDIFQDQSIGGRKTFTLSPLVPDLRATGDTDPSWKEYVERGENLTAAVNVQEAQVAHADSKFHNPFDPEDADNQEPEYGYNVTGGFENGPYMNQNLSVNTIKANAFYGMVWV